MKAIRLYTGLVFVGFLQCLFSSCTDPLPSNALGVEIQWETPIVDGSVRFKGVVNNYKGDISALKWIWNFGDANSKVDEFRHKLRNPNFSYSSYGTYEVSVTVTDTVNNSTSIAKKIITVPYFANIPYAEIFSVTPHIFSISIKGATYKGEKYEYSDPKPDFLFEVSTDPSFDTVLKFPDGNAYSLLPVDAGFRDSIEQLQPGKDYYVRIRTIRYSSFKPNVIEAVSHTTTNIIKVTTKPLPELEVNVDTTTNAELIIIKSHLPDLEVSKANQTMQIFKDNDLTTPYTSATAHFDSGPSHSVYYREPGTTLHFKVKFVYEHPTNRNLKVVREKMVSIPTPNTLFHYNTSILTSDSIYPLGVFDKSNNASRTVVFTGLLSTTLQWNQAPTMSSKKTLEKAQDQTESYRGVGIYFDKRFVPNDAHSYLIYASGGVSYFHKSSTGVGIDDFGTLVVYKEDSDYIYCRLTMSGDYKEGFKAVIDFIDSKQTTIPVYVKGVLLKLKKKDS